MTQQVAGYTVARPLDQVLDELREAWREQADRERERQPATALRERIAEVIALRERREQALAPLEAREAHARTTAEQARGEAARNTAAVDEHARRLHDQLLQRWDQQREQARHAGEVLLTRSGRLGHRLLALNRATETLANWSITWQAYLPEMPTSTERIARYASWPHNRQRIAEAFDTYARSQAEHAHPEHSNSQRAADHAQQQWQQARRASFDLRSHYDAQLYGYGRLANADDLDQRLDHADERIGERYAQLDRVVRRLDRLSHEPVVAGQPPGWLERQHDQWRADDAAERAAARRIADLRNALAIDAAARDRLPNSYTHEHQPMQHDIGHDGPSFGR